MAYKRQAGKVSLMGPKALVSTIDGGFNGSRSRCFYCSRAFFPLDWFNHFAIDDAL